MTGSAPLLDVRHLSKNFPVGENIWGRPTGHVRAVDDVSFYVSEGETLGLVGESGCGKSTIGRLVLQLIPADDGEIRFDGTSLHDKTRSALRPLRRHMQLIQQDPFASLNPRLRVSDIIEESLIVHGVSSRAERRAAVEKVLEQVGIRRDMIDRMPHEFSGGQRQRICIARAIVLRPKLVIADEPVSALDVSVQSQVLNLLIDLQEELEISFLFIAHDLSVVEHMSDRVAVMYLGRIVEIADDAAIYGAPQHPYTQFLLAAAPHFAEGSSAVPRERLEGEVPSALAPPPGCTFHPRCPHAMSRCQTEVPRLQEVAPGQWAACHLHDQP